MGKTCARCEKTVYPIEELKCLDKVWHKQCFKCQVCHMTLNMRNYKGFNKDPYCEAHIPKAKATTVAETPEYRRIAENTKIQSNVKYHADFEKAKGKFTQVADDPETLRIRANSKNISNVAYHGELEKKAFMERQRNIGENGDEPIGVRGNGDGGYTSHGQHQHPLPMIPSIHNLHISAQPPVPREPSPPQYNSPYQARQSSTVIYTSGRGPVAVNQLPDRRIGSIQDLDPVNNFYGSLSSDVPAMNPYGEFGPPVGGPGISNGHRRGPPMYGGVNDYPPPPTPMIPQHHQQSPRSSGRVYRAMYDYRAQDNDEVSFQDGDLIVNCTSIDDGWLTGIVQRTGEQGMLPANYVKPAI